MAWEAQMELAPSAETVPNSVNRYLLPHERQVYPEQLYLEISGLRYPRAKADWEDDDR